VPPPFGAPAWPQPPRTEGVAIAALVLGLVSIITFPVFLPALAAIILALIAFPRVRRGKGAVRGRGLAIAGITLGVLSILGGVLLWVGIAGSGLLTGHITRYADLQTGDCINLPSGGIDQAYHTLSCDQSHDREVIGVIVDPSPSGTPYPGATVLVPEGRLQCNGQIASYFSGFPFTGAGLNLTFLYPARTQWDTGERHIVCMLGHPDGSKLTAPLRSGGTA
jgi:hypothetical protein